MAVRRRRFADLVTHWERLTTAVEANATDLPQVQEELATLKGLIEEVHSLVSQQDLHRATKQEISKRLKEALRKGRKLMAFLHTTIKHHYGNTSEKLVEFGLQPFRGARRREVETETKQESAQVQEVKS